MVRAPEKTDPAIDVAREDPTDVDPFALPAVRSAQAGSFRDEPTAAAETRTVKLGNAPPWLAGPAPEDRPKTHDAMFWPAVVFITILGFSIAYTLLAHPSAR